MSSRIVVLGGGHNGLVAAFYLARAGLKPLVLERRSSVGGGAITSEFHPGFRCSTLAHATGPIATEVVRDLQLAGRVEFVDTPVRLFAPSPDGSAIAIGRDPTATAGSIGRLSERDAARYPDFLTSIGEIGSFLAGLSAMTPPSIDTPSGAELWRLLTTGLTFRQLGKTNAYRLLRWGPIASADLVSEWFDLELLRAAIAAPGIRGEMLGPWSAGSGARLLLQAAADAIGDGHWTVKGGLGALTLAMAAAARDAGAEIRTGAEVREILVDDAASAGQTGEPRVRGLVLAGGERIDARAIVSNADPKRTLLSLVDPVHLTPDFLLKMRNYRARGVTAKINLALTALPRFTAVAGTPDANGAHPLAGRIHIGPEIDYLERAFDAAKYGRYSEAPYLDVTIPTLTDATLAPAGAHVMSICTQFAPFTLRDSEWDAERERLGDVVVRTLAEYAPDLPRLIAGRQVITPKDLESEYGFTGGHIHHGDMALDQLFAMRPLLGWAQYRTPIDGLFLCGAGTHPGGGVTGLPGRNAAREIVKALRSSA